MRFYLSYKMNSKNALDNIKSDFFIRKIFDLIPKNISFRIVNYNKKLQKKLKINIKDFIEINDIYGATTIEIIPMKNKYGKFINIEEKDKTYYHIYFNDNKKEIKNKYSINEEDKVEKIKIRINYKVDSFNYLFKECNCIESIDFKKYCCKKGKIEYIFFGCSSVKELNLSNFSNIKITNTKSIISGCSSLQKINLSNFHNIEIINFKETFSECTSLKEFVASNFHNIEIINMFSTFSGCSSLQKIKLSNIHNNKIVNIYYTFSGCKSLKEFEANNFYKDEIVNMKENFSECSLLKQLNLSNFNDNEIVNMNSVFTGCISLEKLNRSNFNNNEIINLINMGSILN